ncbi:MAG: hypothetical protein HJHJAOHD_00890 [Flavobacteriales bacterium]|nr:hypothetical protein [Flavobacteriales bacterium]
MAAQGQWNYHINFDDNTWLDRFYFDTLQNPNCKWQIGKPSKPVFSSAYSQPNALLTDTVNPLPANDTSVFYLKHERDNINLSFHVFRLKFWYRMDGDSSDFGTIEISPDTGNTWINVLTQDTTFEMDWTSLKPSLKGSTNAWQFFSLDMTDWASGFGTFPIAMTADTILFRFTYITDSSSTPHDGWMIDDFNLEDWASGIEEFSKSNILHIFPNPCTQIFTLQIKEAFFTQGKLILKNILGETCLQQSIKGTQHTIETENLPAGIYILEVHTEKDMLGRQKIMKQ